MVKHQRQVVRKGVVKALTYKTGADDRVFPTRFVPWRTADLPAIAVYTPEESSAVVDVGGDEERTVALIVAVVVAVGAEANVDDALDSLAQQVEDAVRADRTFAGAAFDTQYTGMTTEVADEGGRLVASCKLNYDVKYNA